MAQRTTARYPWGTDLEGCANRELNRGYLAKVRGAEALEQHGFGEVCPWLRLAQHTHTPAQPPREAREGEHRTTFVLPGAKQRTERRSREKKGFNRAIEKCQNSKFH